MRVGRIICECGGKNLKSRRIANEFRRIVRKADELISKVGEFLVKAEELIQVAD